jgi:enolase-phosphatase E1
MMKAIITDIEGTTSSLSFVKEILFPYARDHITAYITSHDNDPAIQEALNEARKIAGAELTTDQLIEAFIQWIDLDKKVTPLKTIQGLLWEKGYREGHFKGHIYADAVDSLRKWQRLGFKIFVYSSGSVYAQKLLFGHTEHGDLNPLFSGYFDTHIGVKTSPDSYSKIASSIEIQPENCLFLSDIKEELDAAHRSGMHVIWLTRTNRPDRRAVYPQVSSFNDIDPGIILNSKGTGLKSESMR